MLAAALAVALAGEAAVAGVRRPGLAEGEREVDPGQHGVGAGRVLLGAAGGQHHHLVRLAEQPGQRAQLVGGHAGDPLDPLGPPRGRGPLHRRRSRWSAPRRTPCPRCRRRPPGAAGRGPAPGRCRGPAARRRPRGPRSAYAAGPPPRPARRARGARRGGGPRAASSRPGWSRPAPARRSARGRPAGTAGRGRARRPGCRPTRPRTCTSGRCSRSGWCPGRPGRTSPAGRPSRWSGRRRRRPPTASFPWAARSALSRSATRSRASSQVAGASSPVAGSRTSGVVSRSRCLSSPVAVQPLRHRPPRFTGNSSQASTCGARAPTSRRPHCSEQ